VTAAGVDIGLVVLAPTLLFSVAATTVTPLSERAETAVSRADE
jgi:hypothetical protein